jgi:glycopeptide antibiotics resistance protein
MIARWLLVLYLVALATIAIWPTPVDAGAGPLLEQIIRAVPWLDYDRIEFAANIVLFVPLGILLALMMSRRHLVVPIAIVASVAIESTQAIFLDDRTASVTDVIANVTGACAGLLIVVMIEGLLPRSRRAQSERE